MMIIYIAGIAEYPGRADRGSRDRWSHTKWQILKSVTIPMVMPSITVCTFLTLTNSFKLFDQNLALTNGEPSKMSEMLALNIFNTFYGRTGYEGVGQAKAVIFFILVAADCPDTELSDQKKGGSAVMKKRKTKHGGLLTTPFSVLFLSCYMFPILLVLMNSFKKKAYISRKAF